jgi:hypothetical protein
VVKPREEFPYQNKARDARKSHCQPCHLIRQREIYSDPEYRAKVNARRRRRMDPKKVRAAALKKYGLTIDQFSELEQSQGGLCAICGKAPLWRGRKVLQVDHCHDTGRVRGLLCHYCNSGMGLFRDNPELLEKATAYLRRS